MIDTFTAEQFAQVLTHSGYRFDDLGYIAGERCYAIDLGNHVYVRIRSSIHNGMSAATGEDSIRAYLTWNGKSLCGKGVPTGVGEQWIKRTSGWESRLVETIEKLRLFRAALGNCHKCGMPRAAKMSHTAKNPNRVFTVCVSCGEWGAWLNTDAIQQQALLPMVGASKSVSANNPIIENHQSGEGALFVPTIGNGIITQENNDVHSTLDSTDSTPSSVCANPLREPAVTGLSFLSDSPAIQLGTDEPSPVSKPFTPSQYQNAIRDHVLNQSSHLRIEAYAGSGKTRTNAWVCEFLDKKLRVKVMVFAKSNQLDMETKIPSWIPAITSHASGRADIIRAWGKVEVDERKPWKMLREMYGQNYDVLDYAPQIVKLVSLCKNTMREPSKSNLDYLCERFNVETNGSIDYIYPAAERLYRESLAKHDVIDFDEMLAIPALGIVPVEQCDLLFVDEYQDNNDAQEAYYLKTGARIVFVGDAFQAVFGFRGAMIGAMDKMQRILNAEQLPLPISYRCARSIIKLAQTIVPGIQAREGAPDGIVRDVPTLDNLQAGDMVLCRNNAPLVKPCFELIRQGRKATIRGRDIGKGLVAFLNKIDRKFHSDNFRRLLVDMQQYVESEAGKLDTLGKESQAAKLRDDSETIIALSDGCYSIGELENRVKKIFADDTPGIVFSTVHKAKGLESERVSIIRPELLNPQKYDKKDWQLEQLSHLNYVAWTRAKQELCFVKG